jgi:hypothetical protein
MGAFGRLPRNRGQDEFHDQTVGDCREALPDAEFRARQAAPLVDYREEELLLRAERRGARWPTQPKSA